MIVSTKQENYKTNKQGRGWVVIDNKQWKNIHILKRYEHYKIIQSYKSGLKCIGTNLIKMSDRDEGVPAPNQ